MITDTIAAIATALSEAGIGIIRVSGTEAVSVVDAIFYNSSGQRKLSEKSSHTVTHGYIVDLSLGGEWRECILDEVMVVLMRAPTVIPWKIRWRSTVTEES